MKFSMHIKQLGNAKRAFSLTFIIINWCILAHNKVEDVFTPFGRTQVFTFGTTFYKAFGDILPLGRNNYTREQDNLININHLLWL